MKIIAEFCSNVGDHAWDFSAFCRSASQAGATDAKVQLWTTGMYPPAMREAKRRYEFPRALLPHFVEVAHQYGLNAGASVFDEEAVDLAARHCDWIKLAAREQDNEDLIVSSFESGKFVYRSISDFSSERIFLSTYHIPLFTIQKYPTGMTSALICLFKVWRYWRGTIWGWSSHTAAPGWLDCALAARLGAQVIEKHLALDPSDVEAGHSLLQYEFKRMVEEVKRWAR